jgi:hypothetical protein
MLILKAGSAVTVLVGRDQLPFWTTRAIMDLGKGSRPARHVLAESAWWAAGSLWLAVMMWAFLNGPRLREMGEQQAAIEEEAENRDVCGRLGMPSGNAAYSACASELAEVRRQQKQRLEQQAAGLL